ncbi:MAG: O-antigen ligase family protein [Anaerolineales bacterium]|nr:O-antigen ligase family protein [Anaerolineales bacterium]
MRTLNFPRPPVSFLWLLPAIGLGLIAGLLPPLPALVLIGGMGLLIVTLIDPRIGLTVTLIVAPLKTLIETEAALKLPLDVGQIALLITLAAWLMRSIADQRRIGLRWSGVYLPLCAFLFAAALSLWGAVSPSATVNELIKWVEILLVMALVGSSGGGWWVAGTLLIAASGQALLGIYQFRGGSGAPHLWILEFRYFRAFGTFGQPNPFGAFMGLTLPLALGMSYGLAAAAWRKRNARFAAWAALTLAAAAFIGGGLIVSWSRGAWLGFASAILMLLLCAPRKRWMGVLLLVFVIGGVALSVVSGLAPASLVARITDFAQDLTGIEDVRGRAINDDNYAVIERLAHWQAALGMANDHPLVGVGFGGYEAAYPAYALMNWSMALGHAHNYYLNVLAETGIVGLAAYVGMWLAYLMLTLRALRLADPERGIALGLLGVWVHLAVHSLFDKLFVNNLFLHIGAMLGLITVLLHSGRVLERDEYDGT